MRYSIRYETTYQYKKPVVENHNVLRVKPTTNARQICEEFRVTTDPEVRLHRYSDYFGTEVIDFGAERPHDRLGIDVRAIVATQDPPDPPDRSWQRIENASYRAAGAEYLLDAGEQPPAGSLDALISQSRARSPLATLLLICELVPDTFEYRPGATYVGSTIADLLDVGAGVCQDFVHLSLALLRAHGIAGRYVSGYLFAAPSDGSEDSVEVNTHAWVEALLPAGDGEDPVWVGADPTNRGLAGQQHVKIGHGRMYSDVPPIRGVYRGSEVANVDASVKMTRLGGT